MTETELKFQIPSSQLDGVRQAMSGPDAQVVRLRARYFDTPDRRLAGAAMALRLRLEGERWVQTLKGRGDGLMQRLEHEVVLDGLAAGQAPALDLSHHDGTPAGTALRRALGDAADTLACRYETDVTRTLDRIEHGGATIERALDLGEIRAGAARWPLQELEFELKDGPVQGLLACADAAVARHGLWLDVRSKAERGERLASQVVIGPAHPAPAADAPLPSQLAALLANIADLADPRCAGQPLSAHQAQARAGLLALRIDVDHLDHLREAATQSLWLALIGRMVDPA
ncbi:CYTH domain-containing protein [Leptothrix sp. BB-4]